MTQEEKQLLLKDLCARLSYGIIGSQVLNNKIWGLPELLLNINIQEEKVECSDSLPYDLENFRPYLRPMSSMTHDEDIEYRDVMSSGHYKCPSEEFCSIIDWLNANHFDYRGLIEKGLALEAKEGIYDN